MMSVSSVRTCVIALVALAGMAGTCPGSKSFGAYAMQICLDRTDCIVVGEIVSTDDFDPDVSRRVSHLLVHECVHGEAVLGDTLAVVWSTGREVMPDGSVVTLVGGDQKFSEIQRSHLWFFRTDDQGELRRSYDPIPMEPPALAIVKQQLEFARHERVPYGGRMADPGFRRARAVDLAVGDSLRAVVAEYLANVLEGVD